LYKILILSLFANIPKRKISVRVKNGIQVPFKNGGISVIKTVVGIMGMPQFYIGVFNY